MLPNPPKCPCEAIVMAALEARGLRFSREDNPINNALDFYVWDLELYIEVKQFHSPRISDQMARVHNVIAIQGIGAAKAFAALLSAARVEGGQ